MSDDLYEKNVTYSKCRCGDRVCKQYTLSTQGSVGFELADARLYAASPKMLAALQAYDKAVGAGINADPELWADAARKSAAAQARVRGE